MRAKFITRCFPRTARRSQPPARTRQSGFGMSKSGTTRLVLVGHEDEINWVSFSPDGRSLATASDDQQIKLWNAETGRIESTLAGHQEQVVAAVFTADGQRVVSGDRKGKVIRWDVVRDASAGSFSLKNGTVQSLAISPDGTILVLGRATRES